MRPKERRLASSPRCLSITLPTFRRCYSNRFADIASCLSLPVGYHPYPCERPDLIEITPSPFALILSPDILHIEKPIEPSCIACRDTFPPQFRAAFEAYAAIRRYRGSSPAFSLLRGTKLVGWRWRFPAFSRRIFCIREPSGL